MKIKQVQICNFRSIKNLDFDFKDFTVLLGANNSGKSNILKALNFFFQNSERITLDDVFAVDQAARARAAHLLERC